MYVYESKNASVGNYLEALFSVESLQVLHIFNGLVRLVPDGEYHLMEVDWHLLENCISLRQVAIFVLVDEVKDWLNTSAKNLTELIITGNAWNLPVLSKEHHMSCPPHQYSVEVFASRSTCAN